MVYQQSKYDKYTCLVSYQMAAVYQGIGIHWKLFASHVSDQQVCQGNSNKRHAALASTFFLCSWRKKRILWLNSEQLPPSFKKDLVTQKMLVN